MIHGSPRVRFLKAYLDLGKRESPRLKPGAFSFIRLDSDYDYRLT